MAYNADNNTVSHYVEDGKLSEEFVEALESLCLSGELMDARIIRHDEVDCYGIRIAWELCGNFDIVYSDLLPVLSDEVVSSRIEDINDMLPYIEFDVSEPLPTLESAS